MLPQNVKLYCIDCRTIELAPSGTKIGSQRCPSCNRPLVRYSLWSRMLRFFPTFRGVNRRRR